MAKVKIWKRLYPTWGNENDAGDGLLPIDEQWSFEAKIRPTLEEIQGVERMVDATKREGSSDEDVAKDMRRLFLALARNPRNLSMQSEETGEFVEVKDMKDMVACLDPSLFNELMLAILEQRLRIPGEGSGQSSGGGITTLQGGTAPLASSEAG